MLKGILKLSRKFLILTILSGGLLFTLGIHSNSTRAFTPKCCWECDDLALICEEVCETHPQQCTPCRNNVAACYVTCNPDPMCTH